ncbi:MAG: PLP-dependent aminotransferase family protein [Caulobacter sp.]|nr:PLP-dependent aminotransferase family protein [Caulobacter sp.]
MTVRALRSALLVRHLGDWRLPGGGPGWRQLAERVRLLVLDGRLPLGATLPGERDLAQALQVSRNMVAAAFAALRDDGFLTSRAGAGSHVSLPEGAAGRGADPLLGDSGDGRIDMTAAVLPAGAEVHAAYARALERLPAALPGHGYEPVGALALRTVLAEHYRRRGLPTTPDQILVTHGAQNAWALLLRWRTRPGDRVVVDHPTYPHALDAVTDAHCRPVAVPLAEDGWAVGELVDAIGRSEARLAYLVVDHHNPSGFYMPAAERARLIAATRGSGCLLAFDETLIDLWLDAPPDAGAPLPDGPQVLRLGSTSKTFWGGLRVGWIRGEAGTIAALAQARASLDLGVAVLEQLATAELLATHGETLEARRAMLRARRDRLLDLTAEHLPGWRIRRPSAGLSLWAQLPAPASSRLVAAAERHGVRLAAGPRFGLDGTLERFIRLPFTHDEATLERAVKALATAWAEVGDRAPARARGRGLEPVF